MYQDLDTPYSGEDRIDNPMGRRTRQTALVLQLDIGLGERLALRAVLPGRDISTRGMVEFDSAGLGDAEVWGRWRLGPELGGAGGVVGAGVALPTGRDSDPAVTDENIVFGAGDYTLLLSAEAFRRVGPSQVLFGLLRYRKPLGAGSNGYRFGEDFGWAGTWQGSPGAGPIGLSLGLSGQHLGRDRQDGDPVGSRGGRFHTLDAGISFPVGGRVSVGALVQRQIERDVRGDQLLSPWNFIAGATVSWGEHRHGD